MERRMLEVTGYTGKMLKCDISDSGIGKGERRVRDEVITVEKERKKGNKGINH